MSGIEVVGLLASASQLAVYTVKISRSVFEIYRRVQDAPKRIQEYTEQIKQLISTARLIEKYRQLQTNDINSHVVCTLDQARSLYDTLSKIKEQFGCGTCLTRYWQRVKGSSEKEILEGFETLEKGKTALLLSIALIHTDLLLEIQVSLRPYPSAASKMPEQLRDPQEMEKGSHAQELQLARLGGKSSNIGVTRDDRPRQPSDLDRYPSGHDTPRASPVVSSQSSGSQPLKDLPRPERQLANPQGQTNTFHKVIAGGQGNQCNGVSMQPPKDARQKNNFGTAICTDNSRQMNGIDGSAKDIKQMRLGEKDA